MKLRNTPHYLCYLHNTHRHTHALLLIIKVPALQGIFLKREQPKDLEIKDQKIHMQRTPPQHTFPKGI